MLEIKTLEQVEKDHILFAMGVHGGDKKVVARVLGCTVKTLYNKLEQYGEKEKWKATSDHRTESLKRARQAQKEKRERAANEPSVHKPEA